MDAAENILKILRASASHLAEEEKYDAQKVKIEHRHSHLHLSVAKPDTLQWEVTMSPTSAYFETDLLVDMTAFTNALRVLIKGAQAAEIVHDRFGRDVPCWATGIHPLGRDIVAASSYSAHDLLKASRSPSWRPEEEEEYLLSEKTGLHLEIKFIRGRHLYRNRGTYATLDVERLPDSARISLIGRKLSDFSGENLPNSNHLTITEAVDNKDAGCTRLSLWGDLVPLETPPPGEDPWWIKDWSALQDLRMNRPILP